MRGRRIDSGSTRGRAGRLRRGLVTAAVLATALSLVATTVDADVARRVSSGAPEDAGAAPLVATSLDQLVTDLAGLPSDSPSPAPSVDPGASADLGAAPSASAAPAASAAPTPTPAASAAPTPTPVPTPTPSPTPIVPPARPRTVDAPVPSRVLASLGSLSSDIALPYRDGCHVSSGGHMPARYCFYGNLGSKTTIALFGDSHALSWFPAVLRLAQARGWRVFSLTMSACIPADIIPWNPATHSVMTACQAWRKAAIARLQKVRPAVILVTGTRGFENVSSSGVVLTGTARVRSWSDGMRRTLARLMPYAGRVILMADTPNSRFSSPRGCLAAHPRSELACATPVPAALTYSWLNAEFRAAVAAKAGFIDPERWVCPTSPCPLVIGFRVLYRNRGHLTATFTTTLWRKLELAVLADLAKRTAIARP